MKFDKTTICGIVVLVCVLAVAGTAYLGGKGSLKVQHGDGTLTFDLQSEDGTRALIERLFEDESDRVTTLSILRDQKDIYPIDSHLANRIRDEDPGSDFAQRLRTVMGSFEGPFSRDVHSFRNIRNLATVDEIMGLPSNDPVADRLRRYAREQRGIFNPPAIPVLIAVSEALQNDRAAVCHNAQFRDLYVQVLNPNRMDVQLILYAGASFTCDGTAIKSNLIKISKNMWNELYDGATYSKPKDGILLEVPRGFKPITEVGM